MAAANARDAVVLLKFNVRGAQPGYKCVMVTAGQRRMSLPRWVEVGIDSQVN